MSIRSTKSLRRAEGRTNALACMKSQYARESLQERTSSQEPAPREPEGGAVAAVSIADRATISNASCFPVDVQDVLGVAEAVRFAVHGGEGVRCDLGISGAAVRVRRAVSGRVTSRSPAPARHTDSGRRD